MAGKLSEEKLKQLRQRLISEKERIEKEIRELEEEDPFRDPQRLVANEEGEDALEEVGHETIRAQISSLKVTLAEINEALERMEKGKYGKCALCGDEISLERLEVAPAARYCINCQRKIE